MPNFYCPASKKARNYKTKMNKILSQKLKKIPKKPGVYLFRDRTGRILYIGKALNLKKRVQSHFVKRTDFFTGQFLDKVTDIDWIKTDSEQQAMLLENQLIKKYQPRYNIQWRDDKSYFFVTFTQEEWPRVLVVHQKQIDKKFSIFNFQFSISPTGPFVNGRELRQALRALRKIIPYRTCKNPYNKPCLQWHIGLCPAHRPNLKFKIKNLKLRNNYLSSLNELSQFLRLYAGEPIRIEAYDISNIQGRYAAGSMIVFEGGKPKKSDYRKFRIKTVRGANDVAMIKEVLKRRFGHPEWPYPDLIIIDGGKAQLSAAISQIANRKSFGDKRLAISDKPFAIVALAKRQEEIYTEYSDKPLEISRLPLSLRLTFQHICDEAHRFAIFYYRYLHDQVVKIRQVRRRRTKRKPKIN